MFYDHFGYVVAFAISIAMQLVALFLAGFLVPETHTVSVRPGPSRSTWIRNSQALSSLPAFYLLMLISFGVMFAWAFIEPQFMFYVYDDLVWKSSQPGLVMSTYGLACMLGEFALSRLSDRLGRKPVLVLGLSLFSAQYIGLVLFRDPNWIMPSFILAGLGNALYDPALSAHILDIASPEYTGRILGLKSTAGLVGSMLGPGLVVFFTPLVRPHVIFLIASALVWLLTLTCAFALRVPPGNRRAPVFSNFTVPQ